MTQPLLLANQAILSIRLQQPRSRTDSTTASQTKPRTPPYSLLPCLIGVVWLQGPPVR
ncbi:hypothetical protein LY78DRAFT_650246 [Colletotrichum sublineola]|nr:hypothetical protein LY78DRAFT_650246 [Colletotrichum sublineola]